VPVLFEEMKIKGEKSMRQKFSKKLSSFILCMMLIVAMALSVTGCNDSKKTEPPKTSEAESSVQAETNEQAKTSEESEDGVAAEGNVLGEGSTQFTFTVVDKEGTETQYEIHTDKETVGDALLELGLIAGDESEYGLYVKTVNGITADYDVDGVYWAFYINGEYASTGVDSTTITEGDTYTFKVE